MKVPPCGCCRARDGVVRVARQTRVMDRLNLWVLLDAGRTAQPTSLWWRTRRGNVRNPRNRDQASIGPSVGSNIFVNAIGLDVIA